VARESRKQPQGSPLIKVGVIAAVAVVLLVWWQWDNLRSAFGSGKTTKPAEAAELVGEPEPETNAGPEVVASKPVWPGDPNEPGDCARIEADLAAICAALDSKDYVREAAPVGGSCALLAEVASAMAQRPPNPSLELRSYETILGNVYHLFRVNGRERMGVLRRSLREEQELAEPLALAMYRWAVSREDCARSGDTAIRREALYAYAGFLFETSGGQAYLRRRSPRVEALASFDALLVIDRAQQARTSWGWTSSRRSGERANSSTHSSSCSASSISN